MGLENEKSKNVVSASKEDLPIALWHGQGITQ